MRFDGRARGWIEQALGPRCTVVRARRLHGGVSSIVHDVTVSHASDSRRSHVVLRRTPRKSDVAGHDPVAEVANEALALTRLHGRALAPWPIAYDLTGEACGAVSLLQTRLVGRPVLVPADVRAWVGQLAIAVREVRDVDDDLTGLQTFRPWFEPGVASAPTWSRARSAWTDLHDELLRSLPPGGPHGVVHRDLHPGNVLFRRDRLSGIVDWTHMGRGPAEVDVSRCRVEIALLAGIDAADAFLHECRDVVPTYDLRWDALVVLELAPWLPRLLEGIRFGASVTLASMQHACDALVIAAAG